MLEYTCEVKREAIGNSQIQVASCVEESFLRYIQVGESSITTNC